MFNSLFILFSLFSMCLSSCTDPFYDPCGELPTYYIASKWTYSGSSLCLDGDSPISNAIINYCDFHDPSQEWTFVDGLLKNKKNQCLDGVYVRPCSDITPYAHKWQHGCDLQLYDVNSSSTRKCMHITNAQNGPGQRVEEYYCTLNPIPAYQQWTFILVPKIR